MKILVVEDEKDLNEVICKRLKLENYSVDSTLDGQSALDYLAMTDYDVIVLDIMLPQVNGLEILERLRDHGNTTPVLLLTARDSIQDRVNGLDAGADDYLIKPFAFDELLARIRVLVRHHTGHIDNVLSVGDLTMNTVTHEVIRNKRVIVLSAKEFAILEYLMQSPGQIFSRDMISTHIWNYDYEGGSNIVDVYIRYLRKKIDEGEATKLIHTVRGAGYVVKSEL